MNLEFKVKEDKLLCRFILFLKCEMNWGIDLMWVLKREGWSGV